MTVNAQATSKQVKTCIHEKRNPTLFRKVQSKNEFHSQAQHHTPGQDLTHFGTWTSDPIWVPPKNAAIELAKSTLNQFGPLCSKESCWEAVVKQHRDKCTQVREIELPKASIRLPQGRLFVAITERENFDKIEDDIPKCVQTRLDEFLAGPGKKRGVKVSYLKPLCIEVENELVFTTHQELEDAISEIQEEVFAEYRKRYLGHLLRYLSVSAMDALLAVPRAIGNYHLMRKKREIEAFHAHVEFQRRKRAHVANRQRNKYRTNKTSFDEILALTDAPEREDVIEHYVREKELSELDREMFMIASSLAIPWFMLSLATLKLISVTVLSGTAVAVCDPAFVAEMPDSKGQLLKIGHFDEVDGVMHVEI